MIQTYQGYFQKGRFITSESVEIPDNIEVYVMVTGRELPQLKTKAQQQLEAFDKFIAVNRAIDDEPLTDDFFDALENNRVSFNRNIDL